VYCSVFYFSVQRVYIRAGSTDSDSGGTQYSTSLYSIHPRYNPLTSDYDVGVVRTLTEMTLDGTNTKAVTLADAGSAVEPGTDLLVSGWGTTSVS
jgi:trypsin